MSASAANGHAEDGWGVIVDAYVRNDKNPAPPADVIVG